MKTKHKTFIDNATYVRLLEIWRHGTDEPLFCGETGEYFKNAIREKRSALSHDEQVRISKQVGW